MREKHRLLHKGTPWLNIRFITFFLEVVQDNAIRGEELPCQFRYRLGATIHQKPALDFYTLSDYIKFSPVKLVVK